MIGLKYNALFLLHQRATHDESFHLVCRVRWTGARQAVSLNLGFTVNPQKWDSATQMCVLKSTHGQHRIPAQVINAEIRRYRDAVDKVFTEFANADIWPASDQVRAALRVELGLDSPAVIETSAAFSEFMRDEGIRCAWSAATIRKLETVRGRITQFGPFASFDGFTSANISRFLEYLRDDCGHNDSTCQRDLGYLRWFCSYAQRRHWLTCDDYKTYRPKFRQPEKPVVFLEWPELMKVWEYDPGERETFAQVRDIFLFECFTSLRFSDILALKWDDVKGHTVELVAYKTTKRTVIDLNKWSEEVLSRYIDVAVPGGYVFPRFTNQGCNRILKEIAQECGLTARVVFTEYRGAKRIEKVREKWELITTHTGRRTFICNALALGVPPSVVMQWTGHGDYRAMKPYIAISDEVKAESMRVFDEKA